MGVDIIMLRFQELWGLAPKMQHYFAVGVTDEHDGMFITLVRNNSPSRCECKHHTLDMLQPTLSMLQSRSRHT
jgi:hypothetical protein